MTPVVPATPAGVTNVRLEPSGRHDHVGAGHAADGDRRALQVRAGDRDGAAADRRTGRRGHRRERRRPDECERAGRNRAAAVSQMRCGRAGSMCRRRGGDRRVGVNGVARRCRSAEVDTGHRCEAAAADVDSREARGRALNGRETSHCRRRVVHESCAGPRTSRAVRRRHVDGRPRGSGW